jgi:hypothetical protein
MLKLSDYRKPDPGRLEEVIFFHHPSARHRIHDAILAGGNGDPLRGETCPLVAELGL